MSIDATRWAWIQKLRPPQKLVLLSLADRAGNDNICWPSLERLHKDTGLDIKTIRTALREMNKYGFIEVNEITGRGYSYRLLCEDKNTPTENVTPTKSGTPTKNGCIPLPKVVGGGTKNGCIPLPKVVPESIRESPKNLSKNLKRDLCKKNESPKEELKKACDRYTSSLSLKNALYSFLEMREEKKKLPTSNALNMILKKLDNFSQGKEELKISLLDRSTINCWLDIYELPVQQARSSPQNRIGTSQHGNKINGQERKHEQAELPPLWQEVLNGCDD